jgi:hypothetical protein
MALIAHGGPRRITALLHELAQLVRPRVATQPEPPELKVHYPPKRDRHFEGAAMAREMYRL